MRPFWSGLARCVIVAALTVAGAAAFAAEVGNPGDAALRALDATALLRFYPSDFSSTPTGAVEDWDVWLAKVLGLAASAPPLLRHSLLMSQTKQEFDSNVALLQQLQLGLIKQGGVDAQKKVRAAGKLAAKAGDVTTNALGGTDNLVYTVIEPCRIMDTRNATAASGVQGPIVGGALRALPGFIIAGQNWANYGGSASSDCQLNTLVGSSIYATALVVTVLNPNFDAYLGIGDSTSLSTVLSTVAVNFTHGQGISTTFIVPQPVSNVIHFAMPTGLSANIIFDVVGYFAVSEATPLSCVVATGTNVAIGAGANGQALSPACPAGNTLVGGGCFASVFGIYLDQYLPISGTWECQYTNTTGSIAVIRADATCCRLAGR
jgi:hypothetical protein